MFGKKKVVFLTVVSLAFALVMANTLWVFAESFAQSVGSAAAEYGAWTMTEVVSTASTDGSKFPSLAVGSDGKVHIAWHDSTDYGGSGTDTDIFYSRFEPGVGWMTTEVVSTERQTALGIRLWLLVLTAKST